jgi:hydroxypyruvate reductase
MPIQHVPDATGPMTHPAARRLLKALFAEAVASVRGDHLIERFCRIEGDCWICETPDRTLAWDLPPDGRTIVVGAGKAVASLAKGLERQLGDRIAGGCIIVKYGHTEALTRIEQIEAGHPVPDERGVAGTRRLLAMLDGLQPQDRVFVLLTGGASALLVAPVDGVTLADKAAVTNALLRSRASIEEINVVRKALSRVKGGRLGERIAPAKVMTLLISDVPGDDLATIGSGPTIYGRLPDIEPLRILERHGVRDQTSRSIIDHLVRQQAEPVGRIRARAQGGAILLATSASIVRTVDAATLRLGIPVVHVDLAMQGGTHAAARAFARAMKAYRAKANRAPCLFVAAGETTLQVTGDGMGGRNQEFALVAARELAGAERVVLLASGTDGTDGPTEAAGGFADGATCARAARRGFPIERALAENDSHALLRALGDLHVTGPTGTNVMDLVLGLAF